VMVESAQQFWDMFQHIAASPFGGFLICLFIVTMVVINWADRHSL
jgi:hypothetical protein